jgi:hypothetical protein
MLVPIVLEHSACIIWGVARVWPPWSSFSAIQTLIRDWRVTPKLGGFAVELGEHRDTVCIGGCVLYSR